MRDLRRRRHLLRHDRDRVARRPLHRRHDGRCARWRSARSSSSPSSVLAAMTLLPALIALARPARLRAGPLVGRARPARCCAGAAPSRRREPQFWARWTGAGHAPAGRSRRSAPRRSCCALAIPALQLHIRQRRAAPVPAGHETRVGAEAAATIAAPGARRRARSTSSSAPRGELDAAVRDRCARDLEVARRSRPAAALARRRRGARAGDAAPRRRVRRGARARRPPARRGCRAGGSRASAASSAARRSGAGLHRPISGSMWKIFAVRARAAATSCCCAAALGACCR